MNGNVRDFDRADGRRDAMPDALREGMPGEGDEIHVPAPSVWPLALGAGISFFFAGVLFHFVFSILGLVLIGFSIAGWIREIHHAH